MQNIKFVKDLSTNNVKFLNSTDTIQDAINLIYTQKIHNIIIKEKDGHYSVFSLSTLLDFVVDEIKSSEQLLAIPRDPLYTLHEYALVTEAFILLEKSGDIIGVVNTKKELCGVVSYTDVTNHLDQNDVNLLSDVTISGLLLKESALLANSESFLSEETPRLKESKTDCIIVLKDLKPDGIITKRDILRFYKNSININTKIASLMSTPLLTINEHSSALKALEMLQNRHFRRAIIVDENGYYKGVINQKNLIDFIFMKLVTKLSNNVENRSQAYLMALEKRTNELEAYKMNLERLVEERTYELQTTNKQLVDEIIRRQSIEKSLELKKEELSTLNKKLEQKVYLSVEEMKNKDIMLFRQSRMAAVGEMISMIAHQWRQPLNSIALSANTIKIKQDKETLDKKFLKSSLKNIDKNIHYMSKTIDDFRHFYKPQKRKVIISLNDAMSSAIHIIVSGLRQDNIKLSFTLEEVFKIEGYKNELIQVFLNILKNSWDALKDRKIEHPNISVTISQSENEYYEICISDNAGGIEESYIEKIFDPYFSTKDDQNGTGIGLYMSKIIIEEHFHGKIIATNIKDGVLFTISIPIKR